MNNSNNVNAMAMCPFCPQIDIASQGDSVEETRKNLIEAIELFFEMASPQEILARMYSEIYVTQIEVAIG